MTLKDRTCRCTERMDVWITNARFERVTVPDRKCKGGKRRYERRGKRWNVVRYKSRQADDPS